MRNIIKLIGVLFFLIVCCRNTQLPKNLLLGNWEGKFGEEKIRLTFNVDSSLVVFYYKQNRQIIEKYKQLNDKLIISHNVSDTCYIRKLDKDNLVLRPMIKLKEDVDLIFLINFKKIN